MVINTNISAQSSARLLAESSSMLSKSLARLSSGSKITSAEDDAAGLAVSMRFDAQINRISATKTNVTNAISFSQTQDGFMSKVSKALDRMSELSILSQDVTKGTDDLALYQKEFSKLGAYIDDLATKDFNGVSLFDGVAHNVTTDSDGNTFSMDGVALTDTAYSTATAGDISTTAGAATALADVKAAITQLATDRATVGANVTRLSYTNEQLGVLRENLGAANSRIEALNVDTAESRLIVNDGALPRLPSIDGDLIAYESNVTGNFDIYVHRLSTSETFAVTNAPGDQLLNNVHGNLVAWMDASAGNGDIFVARLGFDRLVTPGFQPSGLAYDGTFLYVSELSGLRRIDKLDSQAGALRGSFLAPSPTGLDGRGNPNGLAYDGAGHLFVSDIGAFGAGIVYEIDTAGTRILNSFTVPFRGGAIAFDGTNLYIADLDGGTVLVSDRFGTPIRTFDSRLRPADMVFDPATGHLWVISEFDTKISEITTDGRLIRSCEGPRQPGIQGLGGVTLVGSKLYVAEVSDPDPFNPPEVPGTIHIVDPNALVCHLVADTSPPVLTVPTAVTADATSPQGAVVFYQASATDNVDPDPVVACAPPSGSTFPIGTTTVTCTATDAAGNSASATFQVTIRGSTDQLSNLINEVQSINAKQGVINSLAAKLQAVLRAVNAGNADNRADACNKIDAFINEVQAQSGKAITVDQANNLIADANQIKAVLGCV